MIPSGLGRPRRDILLLLRPSTCGYPYPYAQLEAQKRFVSVSVMGRKPLAVASLEGGLSVTRPGGGARGQSVIGCLASLTPEKYWGCVAKDEVLVRPLQSMLQEYMGTAPINLPNVHFPAPGCMPCWDSVCGGCSNLFMRIAATLGAENTEMIETLGL